VVNQEIHQRRLRIDHVNNSAKRCRSVKDRRRLWQVGVRDLVRDTCCALHHARCIFPVAARDLIEINSITCEHCARSVRSFPRQGMIIGYETLRVC
jgi:hypothetical protein